MANFGKDGSTSGSHCQGEQMLAETTRSLREFFMNKFRKLGLIDYNGQIEIHTSLLNVVFLHEATHINS